MFLKLISHSVFEVSNTKCFAPFVKVKTNMA